jgi:collagen type VI alpha
MAEAIQYATTTAFNPSHGGRGDTPHVTVLLTNQPSGSIDRVKLASQTARDNGLVLYTVGIGNRIDTNELKAIASDPDSRHMFTSQNFDALTSLSDLLANKICNGKLKLLQ